MANVQTQVTLPTTFWMSPTSPENKQNCQFSDRSSLCIENANHQSLLHILKNQEITIDAMWHF